MSFAASLLRELKVKRDVYKTISDCSVYYTWTKKRSPFSLFFDAPEMVAVHALRGDYGLNVYLYSTELLMYIFPRILLSCLLFFYYDDFFFFCFLRGEGAK